MSSSINRQNSSQSALRRKINVTSRLRIKLLGSLENIDWVFSKDIILGKIEEEQVSDKTKKKKKI